MLTHRDDHHSRQSLQVSKWLDRELDAETSRELEHRMDEDAGLRREADEFRRLDEALAQWPAPEQTPDLRPAVLARIRRERSASIWHRMLVGWSEIAAMAGWAAAGMIVGFIWLSQLHAPVHTAADSVDSEVVVTMMMPQDVVGAGDPMLEGVVR